MDVDSTSSPTRARAGGTVLSLLAGPLCVPILRAHLEGPLRLPDLRERIGGAAQTTLRGQVGNLRDIGALERHVRGGMPYTVDNELTEVGYGVLAVADAVEAWLGRAPQGPLAFGSESAKGAIRALVAGWDSTMLRALAAQPLSLTELDNVISGISYPAIERRLSAMRAARQVEVSLEDNGNTTKPYAVTEWTRQAVGPLVAAVRCEHLHLVETTPSPTSTDIETAFLLAMPLASPPPSATRSCLLAVSDNSDNDGTMPSAGVQVEVDAGRVVSCAPGVEPGADTWATGSIDSWTAAILEGRLDGLDLDGDDGTVRTLIESVRFSLA